MSTITDLSEKVDELQIKLDAEQEQIAEALAALRETVEAQNAIIADGGTAEQRQAVMDKLNTVIGDLEGTIPDPVMDPPPVPEVPDEDDGA